MRIILIFTAIMLFNSCDPMDDRLTVQNNTNQDLFARFCFVEGNELHDTWAGVRLVQKNEENVIAILGNWKSEFNQSTPMDLYIIIHDDYNLLANLNESKWRAKSDSLIRIGDYRYKAYSYEDLKSRDWKIVYPDNGFDDGISIGND